MLCKISVTTLKRIEFIDITSQVKDLIKKAGFHLDKSMDIPSEKSLQIIDTKSQSILLKLRAQGGTTGIIPIVESLRKPFFLLVNARKQLQKLTHDAQQWLILLDKLKNPQLIQKLRAWRSKIKGILPYLTQALRSLNTSYLAVQSTHEDLDITSRLLVKIADHLQKTQDSAILNKRFIGALRKSCMAKLIEQYLELSQKKLYNKSIAIHQIEQSFAISFPKIKSFPPLFSLRKYPLEQFAKLSNPFLNPKVQSLFQVLKDFQKQKHRVPPQAKAKQKLVAITTRPSKELKNPNKAQEITDPTVRIAFTRFVSAQRGINRALDSIKVSPILKVMAKMKLHSYQQRLPDIGILDLQLHSFYAQQNVSGIPSEKQVFSGKSIRIFKQCKSKEGKRYRDWFTAMIKGRPREHLYLIANSTLYGVDLLFHRHYKLGKRGNGSVLLQASLTINLARSTLFKITISITSILSMGVIED